MDLELTNEIYGSLIETTLHQVEAECSSFDNPETIAIDYGKRDWLLIPILNFFT